MVVFGLFWITLTPFMDLRSSSVLLEQNQGNKLQQLISVSVFLISLVFLFFNRRLAWASLSPILIVLLLWQLVTVFTSYYVDLSVRRYIYGLTVLFTAMAWILLPVSTKSFQKMLNYLCFFVLLLAYFGVIVKPEVSIHNLSEALELVNAGSWRGHFAHKNIAGPAMVVIIIYSLYLLRSLGGVIPVVNVILATIFLYYSNNKTSIGLIVFALILAFLIQHSRSLFVKAVILLVPLSLIALLTLGSVVFQPVADFNEAFLPDPSFTGRTVIWDFALKQSQKHPWIGFGYEAFWRTPDLVNGGYEIETWGALAGHAHNAYLNILLTSGIIGVFLMAIWIIWCPLTDYHRSQRTGNDPYLGLMYLRIWLFMLLYANLEAPFFVPRGQAWFTLLVAILGLRLHAYTRQEFSSPLDKQNAALIRA